MIENILRSIITHEFEKNVGKNQDPMFSKKEGTDFYAMDLEFKLSLFPGEEGYRFLHVRIYAPENYVAVLVKESWVVIRESDVDFENDCLKPGKKYIEDTVGWMLASYHDSEWTSDGVNSIICAYGNRLCSIETLGCSEGWYKKTSLTEADRIEIAELIRARDAKNFSRHWDRDKVQGSLFLKE